MRAKRIVYALNPASGQGLKDDDTVYEEGVELATGATFEELHAATAQALEAPADALIVQGGDGMASMGAEFATKHGVPLGVVPTGTGNDFARSTGIPRGRAARVRAKLIHGLKDGTARFRTVDVLRFTLDGDPHVAVNSINIGFDALVNERANEMRHLRGTTRYLVALLQSVRRFQSERFRYQLDGEPVQEMDAQVLAVLNGRTIGGGIPLGPDARPDDGELDTVIVRGLNRPGLLALFPSALAGLHTLFPQVQTLRGRSIRIESPPGVAIYADGECLRASSTASGSTVEVTIDPRALRLVRAH
ncbi:diacylglycerol/lipid kinase family protein [Gulosibacter molinativorax]|uniref:Diacylglycerol kinase n=1 Tax=Gulosibacter molinativorax TaxID=256821 RepID=A0ABT7C9T3_9MICO|nr:diacylglycerol kinase family protein [Gulosibacter molinativorax]MDJ1371962.1 diacylglycerol kinase [Gulosibacter molinativorax]QUY62674.1 Diacylglycerol kinase [Gulosibacter molinativorax]